MDFRSERHIGDILKDRDIILKGADAATRQGFTQVPNFLLKSKKLSSGDKMTFAKAPGAVAAFMVASRRLRRKALAGRC